MGGWAFLEIDVEGALRVVQQYPEAVTIFLRTPSSAEFERRLRARGTESEEVIQRRVATAEKELKQADRYRYTVVNDRLETAVSEICEILKAEEKTTMLNEFREDDIVRKVGGRFRLSTLLQKRMVALNRGSTPLVDLQTRNLMEIAVAEIMQDKIYLDDSDNVRTAEDESSLVDKLDQLTPDDDGGPDLSDL